MSWFRIDDDMVMHPKVGQLTDGEFRDLIALWSYCKRRDNGGRFRLKELSNAIKSTPRGAQGFRVRTLEKLQEVGLVTKSGRTGDIYQVKDWSDYQPKDATAAERMRRYRQRSKDRNAVTPVTRNARNSNGPTRHTVHTPPNPPNGEDQERGIEALIDLPDLSEKDIQANLVKARELAAKIGDPQPKPSDEDIPF